MREASPHHIYRPMYALEQTSWAYIYDVAILIIS